MERKTTPTEISMWLSRILFIGRLLDKFNRNNKGTGRVPCNCRRKGECPLGVQCNLENVVYKACISPMEPNNDGERIYLGISAGNWKQRLYHHSHSISYLQLRNQTARSKYFWNLKDSGAKTPRPR